MLMYVLIHDWKLLQIKESYHQLTEIIKKNSGPGTSCDTWLPKINAECITQALEDIVGRVTKKIHVKASLAGHKIWSQVQFQSYRNFSNSSVEVQSGNVSGIPGMKLVKTREPPIVMPQTLFVLVWLTLRRRMPHIYFLIPEEVSQSHHHTIVL